MGICSSKDDKSGHPDPKHAQQPSGGADASPAPAMGATPAEGSARSFDMPETPHSGAAAEDGDARQYHRYNSCEKPARSILRPSLDAGSPSNTTSPVPPSRKSTSAASSVGFAVTVNAPDAEGDHPAYAGADSISLKKIVDMFYDKVLANEKLRPFFLDIDMQKLKKHQVRFMGLAFGGKELVFEEDPTLNLRKVHYRLIKDKGLSLEHWQIFVGLFDKTLDQLAKEIPQGARDDAMRSIRATKDYFVPIGQETQYTNSSIAAMPVAEAGADNGAAR